MDTEVSISTEKPAPWRRMILVVFIVLFVLFQSQPRSQPPGDRPCHVFFASLPGVSISTEKPAPWRRKPPIQVPAPLVSFNLNREASPLATDFSTVPENQPFPVS